MRQYLVRRGRYQAAHAGRARQGIATSAGSLTFISQDHVAEHNIMHTANRKDTRR